MYDGYREKPPFLALAKLFQTVDKVTVPKISPRVTEPETPMNHVVHAIDVKPKFDELKAIWTKMLARFFDEKGALKPDFSKVVPCPFCDTNKTTAEFTLNGFRHVECTNCQTLYVTPRLNDRCIEELYSDEYYAEMYESSMLPAFEVRKEKIGKSKFAQILKQSPVSKGRVLDIGGGIGEVSDVFRDNGWQTHITEMNKRAIKWLKTRNYTEVFEGLFDQYQTDHQFDVIMAWGVVEHVLDPNAFLTRVNHLLKPGGIFVSEVPHGNCLLVDYARSSGKDPERILMGEQHIVLYSKPAYEKLHQRAGLIPVHVQTNGLDVSTILKINQQAIAEPVLLEMQNAIDANEHGDLLRGFWTKK
jgi:SAM-dependent methyltransferase